LSIVLTNHFNKKEKQYSNSIRLQLPFPTNDSIKIVKKALEGIRKIYRSGYRYKKVWIILYELKKASEIRGLLDIDRVQSDSMMKTIDQINYRYGDSTIKLASEGIEKRWSMRRKKMSPCYTTRFDELMEVSC
jgi:DNA polymerase V